MIKCKKEEDKMKKEISKKDKEIAHKLSEIFAPGKSLVGFNFRGLENRLEREGLKEHVNFIKKKINIFHWTEKSENNYHK